MHKLLRWQHVAWASLIVVAVFTAIVWREQESGGACYKERHAHAEIQPIPPNIVIGKNEILEKENHPQETQDSNYNSDEYFCGLISPANLPTDYLVIFGILGILVALSTLKSVHHQAVNMRRQTKHIARQAISMRRQTTLLRKSADAALLNARAVIDSERAWLVVELVPTATIFRGQRLVPAEGYTGELSENDMSDNSRFEYRLKITNMGKTPAFIVKYTISRSNGAESDSGQLIDFDMPYCALGAGERKFSYTLDVVGEVANYSPADTAFFFGTVTYEHVFSNAIVQEKFGYVFNRENGQLERIPLPERTDTSQKAN